MRSSRKQSRGSRPGLIGLPLDSDPHLAAWLYGEVAAGDPNCLIPMAFVFEAGRVTPESLIPGFELTEFVDSSRSVA